MTETHLRQLRSQVQTRIQRLDADLLPALSVVDKRLYFNQFLCSDETDRFVLICRSVISTKSPARCDMSLVRSDGSRVIAAIECFPVMPFEEKRLAIAFQDVTARIEAEKTLRANQAELQTLTRRLFAAQEEERHRISRDVHGDYCGESSRC